MTSIEVLHLCLNQHGLISSTEVPWWTMSRNILFLLLAAISLMMAQNAREILSVNDEV